MLTRTALITKSARFHWRSTLGALLAAAAGCAVLTGALIVGDSVSYTLHVTAVERLGSTQVALLGNDRFFTADLAKRVTNTTAFRENFETAEPVLLLPGVCANDSNERRANDVQICGITHTFPELDNSQFHGEIMAHLNKIGPGEGVLNDKLAAILNAKTGDTIRVRLYKPGILPHDAPLGASEDQSAFMRVKIKTICRSAGIGRFSLRSEQSVPSILFVPIKDLQDNIEQKDRANILLLVGPRSVETDLNLMEPARKAVKEAWTLADGQLKTRTDAEHHFIDFSTPRVFLDDTISDPLMKEVGAQGITTYFVNEIRANGKSTPYSMATAAVSPLVDADLKDDEIILNQWTADDLAAKIGDMVELEFYTVGTLRKLETQKASFTLKKIIPVEGLWADKGLMPEFPGIADVESTGDWKAGIPIDKKKIRAKDEDYWKKYKGTPKAFITLKRGVELWKNRFGTYTAIRFPAMFKQQRDELAERKASVLATATPERLGVTLLPVRAQALQAANQSMDFGTLFLSLSFFLIVAALLLMALIFQFGVESRARETGVLLAMGFTAKSVRRLLWGEGIFAAIVGAPLGAIGGILYARALLDGLSSNWSGAVGGAYLIFHVNPLSPLIGCVASVAAAALAIFFAVRKQVLKPARELLNERGSSLSTVSTKIPLWRLSGILGLLFAIVLIALGFNQSGPAAAGIFFGSGAMLLIAALAAIRWLLVENPNSNSSATPSLLSLGIRAAKRKPGRSQATAALLAIGSFLVCAIGVNEIDANADASAKSAGTGGFALFSRATIPIFDDLNSAAGRDKLNLDDKKLEGVQIYPLRVKAGEEASCLNLNHAQKPRILGLPKSFLDRGGFTFAESKVSEANPWPALLKSNPNLNEPIPAVCDSQSLQWALDSGVGQEFAITDESGNPRKLKFVGAVASSILQGSLLISEEDFLRLYPSESGYRQFLIDAPAKDSAAVADYLAKVLPDNGFESQSAASRLAEYNAVQNTYLSTFQALGSLGMLLGSLGLGLVVLRNMLDRRAELAMLRVIGFSRGSIVWMILSEHLWILLLGLGAGTLSALAAIAPSLRISGAPFPWQSMSVTLVGIAAVGFFSALIAAWISLRAPILDGLKAE